MESYTQLDETFLLSYKIPIFKWKSVKTNFSTLTIHRVGMFYPHYHFFLDCHATEV